MKAKLYIIFSILISIIMVTEISLLNVVNVPSYLIFIGMLINVASLIIAAFKEQLTHYLITLNLLLLSVLGPWLPPQEALALIFIIEVSIIIYLLVNNMLRLSILSIMGIVIYISLLLTYLLDRTLVSNVTSLMGLLGINKVLFSSVFSWYLAMFIVFIIIYIIIRYLPRVLFY